MKYLKIYENFENLSHDEIGKLLWKWYKIEKYTINEDGTVDLHEQANFDYVISTLPKKSLTKFPIKFNRADSNFSCCGNKLTTLENCPQYVGGNFKCSQNFLTTLLGGPSFVRGKIYECQINDLKDVYGFPENFMGDFLLLDNPICQIIYLVYEHDRTRFTHLLNDYNVIRNGDTIICDRLEEALYGIGVQKLRVDFSGFVPAYMWKNYELTTQLHKYFHSGRRYKLI